MDNARARQRRVARRFLDPENPVFGVVEHWCKEQNRKSFATWRLGSAAVTGVTALFVGQAGYWVLTAVAVALLVSLLYYPLRTLTTCFVRQRHKLVPDPLLLLIAESSAIDHDTKAKIATLAVAKGAITYSDLHDIAERDEQARERTERTGAAGFRALTSLVAINPEGEREHRH